MFGGDAANFGNFFFSEGFPMQQRPASRGCSDEFIRNLPQKEKGSEASDCYICLEKCKEGEESCVLPCKHAFDRACIENWIKEHDSCPVCRKKLDVERPQPQQPQINNAMPPNMGGSGARVFFF